MTTNQDAIRAGARALCAESNYTFPSEATHDATVAYNAMFPIIAAQAKADALREAAENLWPQSLTDAVPRTEADRTARIIAVKLRRTAATIEGATP